MGIVPRKNIEKKIKTHYSKAKHLGHKKIY
jgi:hypothetical protein